ncbi:uncharacterized protein BT62DRAFT_1080914 [Guyanagaster necrorhizus]|uniref:Uncharacterized protein n=1 Tax=Guyanagaster necrorhizus TaxID=856835 RepID=A0A9P7VH06_9AGAR|nr:uncharacterized protein BT62DRAFT_1080914 [Guyanagaster necrorhizus MCA 3950]KAG7440417.1 hypothetical protein BT62DRAFT_1080914 [Guyanagaster necrorhizus MCA 3950]
MDVEVLRPVIKKPNWDAFVDHATETLWLFRDCDNRLFSSFGSSLDVFDSIPESRLKEASADAKSNMSQALTAWLFQIQRHENCRPPFRNKELLARPAGNFCQHLLLAISRAGSEISGPRREDEFRRQLLATDSVDQGNPNGRMQDLDDSVFNVEQEKNMIESSNAPSALQILSQQYHYPPIIALQPYSFSTSVAVP